MTMIGHLRLSARKQGRLSRVGRLEAVACWRFPEKSSLARLAQFFERTSPIRLGRWDGVGNHAPVGLRVFVVPARRCSPITCPTETGSWRTDSSANWRCRGHDLQVAAGRVDLRAALPANVHLHALGAGRARPPRLHVARTPPVRGGWHASAPFDLVHQLTPVDVGVSLALRRRDAPLVLGPYVPDWAPSGVGADAEVSGAALRVKRVLRSGAAGAGGPCAAVHPGRRGEGGAARAPRRSGCASCRWAWTSASGGPAASRPDRAGRALPGEPRGAQGHPRAPRRLRAARRRDLPSARLLVAGGGARSSNGCAPGSPRHRRSRRVELLGRLDRERARAAMQACAVYCLPSYGDPPRWPRSRRWPAAGRWWPPTRAGCATWCPARAARRSRPATPRALADALHRVLGDPALARSMGEHNRRLVEERYAWPRVVDGLEGLYLEATTSRSAGRSWPWRSR